MGVPIRKHTWNTVSPTQPRHSTYRNDIVSILFK